MKNFVQKRQPSMPWTRLALAGLLAAALAGCGGSDGKDGATGPAGSQGPAGEQGPAGANAVPTLSVGGNITAATPTAAAAWKALAPKITVTSVTINSAPVVNFTVTNADGTPIVGLANYSQATTAPVKKLVNVAFTLAKLVPAANGEPSKWVTYLVNKLPTKAQLTAAPTVAWYGTYPTSDSEGTLVDNGNGSYTYTFYRDVKQAASIVASFDDALDTTGLSKKADLGDVSYDPTLTHRLGIQIGGAAPGTGSNLVDPTTLAPVAGAPAGVNMVNTANGWFDFRPDGAAVTASREIVNINTCASCHQGQVLAHGSRKDPNYCVTCHTDQVKYSFNIAAGIPLDANGNLTGGVTGSTQQKRAEQAILDGRAVGNFPNYIHKLHMGKGGNGANAQYKGLTKTGYNYNVDGGAMLFNNNEYPQDIRNCTTCHDGAATGAKATKNGANWTTVPSMLACGSCHDGINFATGLGNALGAKGKVVGGHVGGAVTDNSLCASCHKPADIPVYHAGSASRSATVDASKRTLVGTIKKVLIPADGSVTVNFSLVNNGVPVTAASDFSGLAFTLAKLVPAVDGRSTQWVSYLARARSKAAAMVPVIQGYSELALGQTAKAPTATAAGRPALVGGTLTAGATAGDWSYKFALVNGAGNINNVTTAQNVSAFVNAGSDYDFTKVATYPNPVSYDATLTHRVGMEVSTAAGVNNLTNATLDFRPDGGAVVTTRNIVTMENCATCHAGRKIHKGYATQYCVTCHNQNTADPYYGDQGHTVDLQNVVHRIHNQGAAYTINGEAFGGFPGNIKNCQACHVETNTAAKDAANWRTMPNSRSCSTCHDSSSAVAHMNLQISGGTVAAGKVTTGGIETCVTCHGPNSSLGIDVKAVHSK